MQRSGKQRREEAAVMTTSVGSRTNNRGERKPCKFRSYRSLGLKGSLIFFFPLMKMGRSALMTSPATGEEPTSGPPRPLWCGCDHSNFPGVWRKTGIFHLTPAFLVKSSYLSYLGENSKAHTTSTRSFSVMLTEANFL